MGGLLLQDTRTGQRLDLVLLVFVQCPAYNYIYWYNKGVFTSTCVHVHLQLRVSFFWKYFPRLLTENYQQK